MIKKFIILLSHNLNVNKKKEITLLCARMWEEMNIFFLDRYA